MASGVLVEYAYCLRDKRDVYLERANMGPVSIGDGVFNLEISLKKIRFVLKLEKGCVRLNDVMCCRPLVDDVDVEHIVVVSGEAVSELSGEVGGEIGVSGIGKAVSTAKVGGKKADKTSRSDSQKFTYKKYVMKALPSGGVIREWLVEPVDAEVLLGCIPETKLCSITDDDGEIRCRGECRIQSKDLRVELLGRTLTGLCLAALRVVVAKFFSEVYSKSDSFIMKSGG